MQNYYEKGAATHYIIKKLYYLPHILMDIKHIKILQPFSIKITHKYKYMSHYSLLPSTHTFSKRILYSHNQLPKSQILSFSNPFLILMHKVTQDSH